jgi:hypothetical protein
MKNKTLKLLTIFVPKEKCPTPKSTSISIEGSHSSESTYLCIWHVTPPITKALLGLKEQQKKLKKMRVATKFVFLSQTQVVKILLFSSSFKHKEKVNM